MGESSGTPRATRDRMTGTVWDAYESVARSLPTTAASPDVDVVVTSAEVLVRLMALYLRAPPTRGGDDVLEHESFLWTACGALAKLLTDEWHARDRPSPALASAAVVARPRRANRRDVGDGRHALVGDGRHALVDDVLDVVLRHDPSDALVDAAFDLLDAISHVGAGSHGSGAAGSRDDRSGEADDRSVVPFSATKGNLRRLARAVEPCVAERRPAVTLRALQTLRGYVEGDAVDEDAEMTESEARAAAKLAAERSRAAWRALTRDEEEEDEDEDEDDEDRDDEAHVSANHVSVNPRRRRVRSLAPGVLASLIFSRSCSAEPRARARARAAADRSMAAIAVASASASFARVGSLREGDAEDRSPSPEPSAMAGHAEGEILLAATKLARALARHGFPVFRGDAETEPVSDVNATCRANVALAHSLGDVAANVEGRFTAKQQRAALKTVRQLAAAHRRGGGDDHQIVAMETYVVGGTATYLGDALPRELYGDVRGSEPAMSLSSIPYDPRLTAADVGKALRLATAAAEVLETFPRRSIPEPALDALAGLAALAESRAVGDANEYWVGVCVAHVDALRSWARGGSDSKRDPDPEPREAPGLPSVPSVPSVPSSVPSRMTPRVPSTRVREEKEGETEERLSKRGRAARATARAETTRRRESIEPVATPSPRRSARRASALANSPTG